MQDVFILSLHAVTILMHLCINWDLVKVFFISVLNVYLKNHVICKNRYELTSQKDMVIAQKGIDSRWGAFPFY